jgi:hypothetical protein
VGRLGIAIVYQDLVNRATQSLKRHNPSGVSQEREDTGSIPKMGKRVCPACRIAHDNEKRYIKAFLDSLDDEEFFKEYTSSAGLCLPHFSEIFRKIADSSIAERLIEVQRDKLSSLGTELGEFIRKHDHRFSHETYGPERDSWRRAIEKMVGKREVF